MQHHSKKYSLASTNRGTDRSADKYNLVTDENKLLKIELHRTKDELTRTKREMLSIYNENLQLKERLSQTEESAFIRQCEREIERLRGLVETLMDSQASNCNASEREEIKDRIIMKLEDELIATKIELKEAKSNSRK